MRIDEHTEIPRSELHLSAARSGGPGGQHVNKVETKVLLRFDLLGSPSLSDAQKDLAKARLGGRLGRDGVLRLSSEVHRSRHRNEREVLARFVAVLAEALRPETPRHETRIPTAERRRRMDDKRKRSRLKSSRGPVRDDD